jgi:hypothetical protein
MSDPTAEQRLRDFADKDQDVALQQAVASLDSYFKDAHCPTSLRSAWITVQASLPKRHQLLPMGEKGNEWYFDCEGFYIDVARYPKDGTYSVYFRLRDDNSEGWYDQADDPGKVRTPISHEELEHLTAGLLLSPPTHVDIVLDPQARALYTSGWRAMGVAVVREIRRRIDARNAKIQESV